jgi:hypothetical protein
MLDWLAAMVLDAHIAVEEMPPAWTVFLGLALFGGAVAVLTWLAVGAWERRRVERAGPAAANLLETQDWLADRTEDIPVPQPGYRGRRRAPRSHPVPAHPVHVEVAATQVIPRTGDSPDATAVIPMSGGRSG